MGFCALLSLAWLSPFGIRSNGGYSGVVSRVSGTDHPKCTPILSFSTTGAAMTQLWGNPEDTSPGIIFPTGWTPIENIS